MRRAADDRHESRGRIQCKQPETHLFEETSIPSGLAHSGVTYFPPFLFPTPPVIQMVLSAKQYHSSSTNQWPVLASVGCRSRPHTISHFNSTPSPISHLIPAFSFPFVDIDTENYCSYMTAAASVPRVVFLAEVACSSRFSVTDLAITDFDESLRNVVFGNKSIH